MSRPLSTADVIFEQRFLKCAGLYRGRIDAIWGSLTDTAFDGFSARSDALAARLGRFDARSERHIASLHLAAQQAARRFLRRARSVGFDVRVISGTRSYAEQDRLYRQGRHGRPGPRVTKARGGQSRHNFGIAWDVGIFDGGAYVTEPTAYDHLATVALADGIVWGGHWQSFVDRPHYELAIPLGISEIRRRFERGEPYVDLGDPLPAVEAA